MIKKKPTTTRIDEKKEPQTIRSEPVIRNSGIPKEEKYDELEHKAGFRIWEKGYELKKGEIINYHKKLGKVVVKYPGGKK